VLQVVLHVEEDHQAIVEALATDAPLVHECQGVGVGLVGRVAVALDLRVYGDLGARPSFDRLDRRLGISDGPGREDPGVVVHALPADRIGVGRARRRRGRRRSSGGCEEEPESGNDKTGDA
jgi:hypothetical protein